MRCLSNALILLLIFGAAPVPLLSQRIPAAANALSGELVIEPSEETWVMLTSTAFFSKPTTLIEHRELSKLRGILSTRHSSLKAGQIFNERKRLGELCENVQQSYSSTKNYTIVQAKIVAGSIPYCRIRVHEKDGLTIDQLLFVGKTGKTNRNYVTHTATFFYPASEEERALKEVTKFVGAVSRRRHG